MVNARLSINGNTIVYQVDSETMWSLEVDRIKFIGEYTTSAGPWADDYFFVFADTIDVWWQVPTEVIDHEVFWSEIGKPLNCKLAPGLFASTEWATRVIYPKNLEGHELFEVVKTKDKPKSFWQKLFKTGGDDTMLELTEEVKQLFQNS